VKGATAACGDGAWGYRFNPRAREGRDAVVLPMPGEPITFQSTRP